MLSKSLRLGYWMNSPSLWKYLKLKLSSEKKLAFLFTIMLNDYGLLPLSTQAPEDIGAKKLIIINYY